MSNYENFLVNIENQVATITVNRESKLNALSQSVLEELKSIFLNDLVPKELYGVILTGQGEKAFIAGADIKSMSSMSVSQGEDFGRLGQEVTFLIEHFERPVIAVVNGFALGGGCEMAMSADFIYATQSAIFGQPEVKLGLIPGFGGTQRLAKYVGRNRAKELIYTGDNLTATDAKADGLVNKVFKTKQEALDAAAETLKRIGRNSPLAVATSKRVMNEGNDLVLDKGLGLELAEFGNLFGSYDLKEGTAAFVEKRRAQFKGE